MERNVRSGLVMAWRLATSPTSTSPDLENATTDGAVRAPSELGMTTGSPPSRTDTTELVVPRSMPTALAMSAPSSAVFRAGGYEWGREGYSERCRDGITTPRSVGLPRYDRLRAEATPESCSLSQVDSSCARPVRTQPGRRSGPNEAGSRSAIDSDTTAPVVALTECTTTSGPANSRRRWRQPPHGVPGRSPSVTTTTSPISWSPASTIAAIAPASAHEPSGNAAFSTLQPVTTVPAAVRSATPTR